jgi:hypothetical protein
MIPNLVTALSALCETEPPEITGQGFELSSENAGPSRLFKLGALTHVGNTETVLCLECDEPHSVRVEYDGDQRYRAYCPDTGYQPIEPEALKRFCVSEKWIVDAIAQSLGFKPSSAPGLPLPLGGTVVRIGQARFRRYTCELFFARRLSNRARLEEAKSRIIELVDKSPAILLTTTPIDLVPGEPSPRCAILTAKKAQGAALGNPRNISEAGQIGRGAQQAEADRFAANVLPLIQSIRRAGCKGMVSIAKELNDRGVRTARGGRWHPSSVRNLLARARLVDGQITHLRTAHPYYAEPRRGPNGPSSL